MIHCELNGRNVKIGNEDYRREWLNSSKTNFKQLRIYFEVTDWSELIGTNDIEEKWTKLLDIYDEGVMKWVPKTSTKNPDKKEWNNRRCTDARLEKEEAWKKWRKNKTHNLWAMYVRKRNEQWWAFGS